MRRGLGKGGPFAKCGRAATGLIGSASPKSKRVGALISTRRSSKLLLSSAHHDSEGRSLRQAGRQSAAPKRVMSRPPDVAVSTKMPDLVREVESGTQRKDTTHRLGDQIN